MKRSLLALALALVAVSASGQDWRGQLSMVDHDLRTQRYEHARKWSIKMINSMCDHLGTGQEAMYTLSLTVAYRALAEAGLGRPQEADWYWHVAGALYPKLMKKEWPDYGGPAAEWLRNRDSGEPAFDPKLPPPVPVKMVDPDCPLSAINGGYFYPVTMSAIVDGSGIARCPRLVLARETPTLIYEAFEALKQWRFEPPPGPAEFTLTVHFKAPRKGA